MAHDPDERLTNMTELALALLPFASPIVRDYWEAELRNMPEDATALVEMEDNVDEAQASQPSELPPLESEMAMPAPRPVTTEGSMTSGDDRAHRGHWWPLVTLAALIALAGGWLFERARSSAPMPVLQSAAVSGGQRLVLDVEATPSSAQLSLDGEPVAVGHYIAKRTVGRVRHELRVAAPGYVSQTVGFFDAPPPNRIDLLPESAPIARAPVASDVASKSFAVTNPSRASRMLSSSRRGPSSFRKTSALDSMRTLEAPVPEPSVAVIEQERPKIRIVDELKPHVQLVE
jgi:hypothetical protein